MKNSVTVTIGSESSAVFKQLILEEHWLSGFSSYLWYWGSEAVVEVRCSKDKFKEEEDTLD